MNPKFLKYMETALDDTDPGSNGGEPADNGGDTNWRSMFGDDPKLSSSLERYKSPADFGKAFLEARSKISQGGLTKPLPENATPEDLAAWRADNGIPAEPKEYLSNLPEGLVLGEDDLPIFESLAESLHAKNMKPEVVHGVVEWYTKYQEEQAGLEQQADINARHQAEEVLREEWGSDYRANINIINSYLDTELGEGADLVKGARDANGVALFNNPTIANFFIKMAREMAPMSTIVGDYDSSGQAGETRIATLEGWMKAPQGSPEWNKYWKDDKAQAELRKLYEAQERRSARQR